MKNKTLRVALAQRASRHDRQKNMASYIGDINKAASDGAELVLLPELHNSDYFCQVEETANFDLAESIPGPSTEQISRAAADGGIVVVASLFERRAAGLYHNTAVVFDKDGSMAGIYRKMHIPDDPGYYEKFYFTPGDLGFRPIETSIGKLGVLVCWDQWYPEAARLMALAGAEMLLYPTAIGWDERDDTDERQRQLDAWVTIQRSHAVANGVPVLSCNRSGDEEDPSGQSPGIAFWGNSFVCGPQGELLERTGNGEQLLLAEVPLARSEEVRRIWPYLRDRRIDAYQDIVRRYID